MTKQEELIAKLGFKSVEPALRRLFITSEGDWSTGKTTFLRSCPPPIGVIDFDKGMEGVAETDIWGGPILRKSIELPDLDMAYVSFAGSRNEQKSVKASDQEITVAMNGYLEFKSAVDQLLKSGAFRTLAIDGGGAAWGMAQVARFGQVAKYGEVPGQMWRMVGEEFERIFSAAHDHGTNLVVTHRRKGRFQGPGKKMDGYEGLQFAAHVHLIHEKSASGELSISIGKCRQRDALTQPNHPQHKFDIVRFGEDPVTESIGGRFSDIALAVFPNTTEKDWGLPE
jgi:hypothetical protein